jgi:hypothetical protein
MMHAVDAVVVVTHHSTSRYRKVNNKMIIMPRCELRYVCDITVFVLIDQNSGVAFNSTTPSPS